MSADRRHTEAAVAIGLASETARLLRNLDRRVASLDQTVADLDHRVENIDRRIENIDQRLAAVEQILPMLATKDDLKAFPTEEDPKGLQQKRI